MISAYYQKYYDREIRGITNEQRGTPESSLGAADRTHFKEEEVWSCKRAEAAQVEEEGESCSGRGSCKCEGPGHESAGDRAASGGNTGCVCSRAEGKHGSLTTDSTGNCSAVRT